MDDVVQIPTNLLARFKSAAAEVEKASEVRVISHNDADGISSAAIVCATLLRKNKRFQCTMSRDLRNQWLEALLRVAISSSYLTWAVHRWISLIVYRSR